ncbi:RsmB/NOP family class I SAM-dependent RNA methyltransferase [Sneathiella chinensis]|uniref:rRNA cytosine-C5-methylase n=1 Tax=Sneathiella chinensis TaxID=349750 RepID=A0ABQ5U624_9PROT|nr:RsmB/NOP family class I SAM-dependent RNA methyltransferase [Sneathiella chinensis]GLQ07605.1 rRNA cytosine-C5-methylase [Sneathiella chinensis]
MTPSARLSSVIELLTDVENTSGPAEHVIKRYFKARRFAGSKDRRWITEFFYDIQRRRGELVWLAEQGQLAPVPRSLALVGLVYLAGISVEEVESLYLSGSYAADPLSPEEKAVLVSLPDANRDAMPLAVRGNFPDWLMDRLTASYGARMEAVLQSFQDRAPFCLRVNTLKTDREEVCRILAEDGIPCHPTEISPVGIRIEERVNLNSHPVMERGLVEIQDEAAQIAALLADAGPGMNVVDYCCGAGGKALVMAATMQNTGLLRAFDINPRRMKDIAIRTRRAAVGIVQSLALQGNDEDAEILSRIEGEADRVFVDAPCSGSGTWRRQPDQRWSLTPEGLADLVAVQADILDTASALVAPGGRLVYATCSILEEENASQIAAFLARHPDFEILPVSDLWDGVGLSEAEAGQGDFLSLTPADYGTDGFFTAILQRTGA